MFSYQGTNIFYERSQTGAMPVLLLHGWGTSGKTMSGLKNSLEGMGADVIVPDFPGFGASSPPPPDSGLEFYADCVEALMKSLGYERFSVAGHSFGGRVALILARRKLVDKMILISSAGLKPRFSLKKWLKVKKYKLAKRLGFSCEGGSDDYKALPDYMKPIFVRIVNNHLDDVLPEIDCKTLIMWGKEDRVTPVFMAEKFKKGIVGSEIVWLSGGHFAYIEDGFTAAKVAEAFLC